jgi:hypothetical protein
LRRVSRISPKEFSLTWGVYRKTLRNRPTVRKFNPMPPVKAPPRAPQRGPRQRPLRAGITPLPTETYGLCMPSPRHDSDSNREITVVCQTFDACQFFVSHFEKDRRFFDSLGCGGREAVLVLADLL